MTIYQAGPEVLVNTTTVNVQTQPAMTTLSNGDYVLTWASDVQDGSSYGVYAQRYDSAGVALGSEYLVNTTTNYDQSQPHVAALTGGGYVVTWSAYVNGVQGYEIYSQRFDSNGVALGVETLVNTDPTHWQTYSSVYGLNNGGYVVTWSSLGQDGSDEGIYFQRFDANGVAQGLETQVNTTTASYQGSSDVTVLSNGTFVVTWQGIATAGTSPGWYDIYMQRYDANGVALGTETVVNTDTFAHQYSPSITPLSGGGYVVAWNDYGISLQVFDSSGVAIGTEVHVNNNGNTRLPEITVLSGGGFVVVYDGYYFDGNSYGILGQRFDAAGVAVGAAFAINTTTAGSQFLGAVTALGNDGFVVSWTSGDDVYTRTFSAGGDAPVVVADIASGSEDAQNSVNVVANDSDADSNAMTVVAGSITVTGFTASPGLVLPVNGGPAINNALLQNHFSANGGEIVFNPFVPGHSFQFLDSGQSITVTMTYNVTDGVSNVTPSTLTFTINGANEVLNLGETADFLAQGFIDLRFGDNIFANGGDDVIYSMSGNDLISGGSGDDRLYGGDGNDTLAGGIDDDIVSGGSGDDTLRGGLGDDTLSGGSGNDVLIGGDGADRLTGGSGVDVALYHASLVGVTINLITGSAEGGEADGDTLSGIESVTGTNQNDSLAGSNAANTLTGLGGNDLIIGLSGNDTLDGGSGDDTIEGGAGGDTMDGGSGTDMLSYATSNLGVSVNFVSGAVSGGHAAGDSIVAFENVQGSAFNDTITGNAFVNVLLGGGGNDVLSGGGDNDLLYGNDGDDTIYGGSGNDTIEGGGGNDLLYGGVNNDVFKFSSAGFGTDTVTGWVNGEDLIDLTGSGLTYASFTQTQVGGATQLTNGTDVIILLSTLSSTIDVTDFVF